MIDDLIDGIKRRIDSAIGSDDAGADFPAGDRRYVNALEGLKRFVVEWENRAAAAVPPDAGATCADCGFRYAAHKGHIIPCPVCESECLHALINTPETNDFMKAVPLEAAHQVERWGEPHDRGKSAENWFWLIGYLAGKALRSALTGDREKAKHHTISSAAALLNWHRAISRDATGTGIGTDVDLNPETAKR